MKTSLLAFLGVVTGMALALVLVIAVELFSSVAHPFPSDFKGTMDEVCQHVARYPDWVLAVCGLGWAVTAFVSAWIATRIGGRWAGLTVIALLTVALVCNVTKLPYAMWFKLAMPAGFAAASYLGYRRGIQTSPAIADSQAK